MLFDILVELFSVCLSSIWVNLFEFDLNYLLEILKPQVVLLVLDYLNYLSWYVHISRIYIFGLCLAQPGKNYYFAS